MKITTYGNPAPQGSKRKSKAGYIIEDCPRTMNWRDSIKQAVMLAYPVGARGADTILHHGPVAVVIKFSMKCPKRAKPGDWVTTSPDVDKLCRCVLDPLTEMGVFEDDARVARLEATKRYAGPAEGVLALPGAVIEVFSI